MAANPPDYDNVRLGGPDGLRYPLEQGKATFALKHQVSINIGGAGSTNTVNLAMNQTIGSEYVFTNAGSGATAVVWPGAFPALVFVVHNNSGQAMTLGVTGQTAIAGPANGTRALFVCESANIARVTPDQGINGPVSPASVPAGATLALTPAQNGSTILLNQASGSVVTLPAATGSGNRYRFIVTVTTTSAKDAILAASVADFIQGYVIGENAGTTKAFTSTASTNHSLQMPFAGTQPSGGFIGDQFDLQDIAANLWQATGMYQAGVTPTTPFSAATT